MNVLGIERREDGVAVLTMDIPEERVNTLRASFGAELARALDELEGDAAVRAIVFRSGKEDFIVGADLRMLEGVGTAREAQELARSAQRSMDRVARLRKPVVAAIHGGCLGGGLELALACHGRVASDARRTKLGLPECQLGLLPGAGGTQRLPRLVGIQHALDLLLTGKQLRADRARKIGLVDEVVPASILLEVACGRALELARGPAARRRRDLKEELSEWALRDNPLGRRVVFDQARKALLRKTRGNYPAQERILEVVKVGLEDGLEAGLEAEAAAFGELVVSPQAAQLMSIFFATTAMKKDRGVDDPEVSPRALESVGILGAGLMGAGIACVSAQRAGLRVRLKDRDAEGVGRGLRHVASFLGERVRKGRMRRVERDRIMTRITGTTDYSGFGSVPLVIEAVFEDLALKHRVLREVEEAAGEDVIFASNTSSIPIAAIAEGSRHPETVIGMHYFSPVEKMPLLEIIVHERTADWVVATAVELGKRQGKTVIVVHDGVGFYTSRILGPLMNEAAHVLSEGVPIEAIDRALVDWGFPVGPIALLDEVGIDVAEKVGRIVHEHFGERMRPPAAFERLGADGRQGRKNGRGFYLYGERSKGGRKEVDESVYEVLGVRPGKRMEAEEIAQRCALAMVNEAALCFGEGILRSARDGDIGAIFGLGFPPFRGGPFRYVDAVGAKEIVRRLRRLRDRLGNRFAPAPVLVEMAESGGTFHGSGALEPGRHRGEAPAPPASATSRS